MRAWTFSSRRETSKRSASELRSAPADVAFGELARPLQERRCCVGREVHVRGSGHRDTREPRLSKVSEDPRTATADATGSLDAPRGRPGSPARACRPKNKSARASASPSSVPAPAAASAARAALPSWVPADDGQWTMPAKDYASSRYSSLDQITAANAKNLKVAFTFSTGVLRGHEAAPLVVGSTMYVVTPYPNILYALDLTQPGAPVKWNYKPNPSSLPRRASRAATSSTGAPSTRTAGSSSTRWTTRPSPSTPRPGRELWRTKIGRDQPRRDRSTMAPLVVKGKVLVGNSGGEFGVRGWLDGARREYGHVAWAGLEHGTGQGRPHRPALQALLRGRPGHRPRGHELARRTCGRSAAGRCGAGSRYDPELNLIYYGTANPGPWNPEQRPGDNKWTAGIFARDPKTGEAAWVLPVEPARPVRPRRRQREHPARPADRNGAPRKVARPPGPQRLPVRDRPRDRRGSLRHSVRVHHHEHGGRSQDRPAHPRSRRRSPEGRQGHARHLPGVARARRTGSRRRSRRGRACSTSRTTTSAMDDGGHGGELHRRHALRRREREDVRRARRYIAARSRRGTSRDGRRPGACPKELPRLERRARDGGRRRLLRARWRAGSRRSTPARASCSGSSRRGSGIIGQPITYRGPDGKQYVAILSGVGGWAGAIVSGGLDPRDGTARPRVRQRDEGPARRHDEGRHALRLRASVDRAGAALLALAAAGPARRLARRRAGAATPRAPHLRRPEQPAVLQQPARGIREPDRASWIARDLGADSEVHLVGAAPRVLPQHPQGRRVRRRPGRPVRIREGADDDAVLPLDATSSCAAADSRGSTSARSTTPCCGSCASASSSSATTAPTRRRRTRSRGAGIVQNVDGLHALRRLLEGQPAGADRRGRGEGRRRRGGRLGAARRLLRAAATGAAGARLRCRRRSTSRSFRSSTTSRSACAAANPRCGTGSSRASTAAPPRSACCSTGTACPERPRPAERPSRRHRAHRGARDERAPRRRCPHRRGRRRGGGGRSVPAQSAPAPADGAVRVDTAVDHRLRAPGRTDIRRPSRFRTPTRATPTASPRASGSTSGTTAAAATSAAAAGSVRR